MRDEHALFMDIAKTISKRSYAEKMKVGAVIVKDCRIISMGYNGTPTGWDNCCEELALKVVDVAKDGNDIVEPYLLTKPEVLHAETNAIAKVAQSNESSKDATLYTTCAPCLQCAKLIYQSGISKVVYGHAYRSQEGLDFLNKAGLEIIQQEV